MNKQLRGVTCLCLEGSMVFMQEVLQIHNEKMTKIKGVIGVCAWIRRMCGIRLIKGCKVRWKDIFQGKSEV